MGAYAAVRGVLRIPLAGPAFRWSEASGDAPECDRSSRIGNIRNILRQAGYTAARLSLQSGRLYGSRSPYFIPPTFFYKLRRGITPQICQVVALSEITGYRFVDWMKIYGFDLHQIPRLQLRLHTDRTVLVTPIEFGPASFLSPFSSLYESTRGLSLNSRQSQHCGWGRYLFAKIGGSDALMCPGLKPGSVVRVDRGYRQPVGAASEASAPNLLWLVELANGLTCCRVRWIEPDRIVLLPARPSWGIWPLRVPAEARILGLVDMEFRPAEQVTMQPRARPMKLGPPPACRNQRMGFSDLLRASRRRTGLTFRKAHRLTRVIANIQGNPDYAVALGLLSDYEAMGGLPRHIAKIISLCITFCVDIRELMEAAGVAIDDSAKMPLVTHDSSLAARPDPFSDLFDEGPYYRTIAIGARYSRPARDRLEYVSQI